MNFSRFRLAAAVLLLCVVAFLYIQLSLPDKVQAETPPLPSPPIAFSPWSFTSRYAPAAQALRNNDLQEARHLLGEVARRYPDEAERARILEGLYAHELDELALAEEILAQAAAPGNAFEDWRLYLLAESAQDNGHHEKAAAVLGRLIADYPASPLRARAFLEAAELAYEAGDERRTLELIDGARRQKIGGEEAVEIENLAWKLGKKLNDHQVRREAARRLLVDAPMTAGALEVADTFRALDGSIDWNHVLSNGGVMQRARSFLDVERLTAALDTLDHVPAAERDLEWHLIKARALTEADRAQDALTVLDQVDAHDPVEQAGLEWERAMATASAGLRLGGAERRALLVTSHRHLAKAAELGATQMTVDALRGLYEDFLAAGLFEPAMDALRILRRIDTRDTTGARKLWERGWEEYRAQDLEKAVTWWTELADIYPGHTDAQRGLYWQARALEKLGREDGARQAYRRLVASSDTTDFYRRRAMARLGVPPVSSDIELARSAGSWLVDPLLQRAKALTDLGLDKLAGREMELVEAKADPRDLLALKALIMGRDGGRRTSIALLREAFPALGGPRQSAVPDEVLRAYYPLEYGETILAQARENDLPAPLVAGIIRQESAFDPRATSPVGARGLMQLMPATASETARRLDRRYPSDGLYDPEFSIELGTAYLRQLLNMFDGNVELAVAGYNGGPNRIQRLWKEAGPEAELDDFVENLGIDESRDYVKRVLVLTDSYRQLYPSMG